MPDKPLSLLVRRGKTWWYKRGVPAAIRDVVGEGSMVQINLKTRDVTTAKRQRDILRGAQDRYWGALQRRMAPDATAREKYESEVALAREIGVDHKPFDQFDLTKEADQIEATRRALLAGFTTLKAPDIFDLAKMTAEEQRVDSRYQAVQATTSAVLGMAKQPRTLISDAVTYWLDTILADAQASYNQTQIKNYRVPKKRAVKNFIKAVGDKPVLEITPDDALVFYRWLRDRVRRGEVGGSTAQRDFTNLSKMFADFTVEAGRVLQNPFENRKLFVWNIKKKKRVGFSEEYIARHFLKPSALMNMSGDLRAIFLVCLETGMRPSELINTPPFDIHLDANIPYIDLRIIDDGPYKRTLKNEHSQRHIPLTRLALKVMRHYRDGFPHYSGDPDTATQAINKFLKENDLREFDPDAGNAPRTLYSLRHAWASRSRRIGLDSEHREQLMGHSLGGRSYVYGDPYYLDQDLVAMEKMARDYDPAILEGIGEMSKKRKRAIARAQRRDERALHAARLTQSA